MADKHDKTLFYVSITAKQWKISKSDVFFSVTPSPGGEIYF